MQGLFSMLHFIIAPVAVLEAAAILLDRVQVRLHPEAQVRLLDQDLLEALRVPPLEALLTKADFVASQINAHKSVHHHLTQPGFILVD